VTTNLGKITEKAKQDEKVRFTSLAHLLTPEFMIETWQKMNKRGTHGVDKETIEEFEEALEDRVQDLWKRLKENRYKAPPVRRVYIPKGDGRKRPLGIPTVEDRLLQACVARILNAVFDPLFLESSYGFRPGCSAHGALRALREHLITDKVMQVYEADIQSYFDRVNHEWLRKMLRERIVDRVILRLIDKWLKAGVLENGVKIRNEEGVPQGGPISPILANIYLHYVLDLWFTKRFIRTCQGKAYIVRFADDYVACFQYREDALRFGVEMKQRLLKFNLTLSEAKTRRLVFGRFARERLAKEGKKPEEFEFLGFRHICGIDRNGKFALIRLPKQKSISRFLDTTKEWLWEHMHWKVRDQQRKLSEKLQGFYAYYALPHCCPKLSGIRYEVMRQWRRTLCRRSQRSKTHWSYLVKQSWFKLPGPVSLHPTV
jgi:RNA-directed DNA polymerase